MSKIKLEVGKVYKNRIGQFTKVVRLDNDFVYSNGWHFKEEMAQVVEGTNGTHPVNEPGFLRALGECEEVEAEPELVDYTVVEGDIEKLSPDVVEKNDIKVGDVLKLRPDHELIVEATKAAKKKAK